MSGALGGLLESLFTASWRGIEFHMPDTSSESGRRVLSILFPGSDRLEHEDLGAAPRRISVTGIIIGDDYVRRAEAIEAAFRKPGEGTLSHPWLGEIECVLVDAAKISFAERELRVARFTATFERVEEEGDTALSTIGQLLAAIDGVRAEARAFLRRVLAPVRLALGVVATVSGFVGSVGVVWRAALAGVRGGGILRGALAGPLDALSLFTLPITFSSPGDALADATAAPARAAGRAAFVSPASAVGPGPAAEPLAAGSPRAAAGLLLAVAAGLAAGPAEAAALRLSARAQVLAEAADVVTDLLFESRADARSWRGRLDAGIAAAIDACAALAAAEPEGAGRLLAALHALRAAALADLDERIGRLPEVVRLVVPPTGASAWLLANHLVGDDAGRIVGSYLDLVARNRLAHPALIEGGREIEALP